MSAAPPFPMKTRIVLGSLCLSLVLLILAGALSIPFLYPSSSILYKFGTNKLLLRGGKMVGLAAAVLLCLQALLSARFIALERIFAVGRLLRQHRTNGLVVTGLILLHPLLIVGSENFTFFTLEPKYWPEFVGVGLLVVSLLLIATAQWRAFFRIDYQRWRLLHGTGAFLVLCLLFVHVLFVSESFSRGLPRGLALLAAGLNLPLFVRIGYQRMFSQKKASKS